MKWPGRTQTHGSERKQTSGQGLVLWPPTINVVSQPYRLFSQILGTFQIRYAQNSVHDQLKSYLTEPKKILVSQNLRSSLFPPQNWILHKLLGPFPTGPYFQGLWQRDCHKSRVITVFKDLNFEPHGIMENKYILRTGEMDLVERNDKLSRIQFWINGRSKRVMPFFFHLMMY